MEPEIVLSIVLAISTVLYTIVTVLMYIESVLSRRQKTRPLVIMYLKSTEDHQTLKLCVKNVGEGTAKDVKVKVLKDYLIFGNTQYALSKLPICSEGVSIYPSQYELQYSIHDWNRINKDDNDYIKVQVSYRNLEGKKYEEKPITLYFNQVVQIYSTPPETNMGKIAYYLKSIDNKINKS